MANRRFEGLRLESGLESRGSIVYGSRISGQ